jgi:hypothetical protein
MLKAGIVACLTCAAALLLASTGAGVHAPSTATTGASSQLPAKANVSSFLELHGNAHLENLPVAMQAK